MALSTTQYGYIIDPMVPFTDSKGDTIKNGFVRVFVAGSSTPVMTYRNFDGAANPDIIELDNSGRTMTSVIGSKGLTYKVCVYDKDHSQESPILTVDKVSVIGANITAGAGATVVTGIDGLTTKPHGFVDASVVGTDGYVALDHTLVTDNLDTDAKATAVENDRYIPLLNNDVNNPDSKITLGRLFQWVYGNIKNQSPVIKFVEPSLDQVTSAIADGYIPMIKRPAGQGYRYYLLMWAGSEAWFASVGTEEISRLVITGSGFTETTDKLRDVVTISLIDDGFHVSNNDYNTAFEGAADNRIVVLQASHASVTSRSYLIAVGSIGLRFMRVSNDKIQLVNVSPAETPDGHAVTYENLVSDGGFNDIVAFEFTDYTDSVDGNIAYPIANNKMQIQSDWDGSLNNQAAFIAPSDTSNNAIVKLENVQTTINWNVQIWNHSKTALLPLVPGSATVFKKDASYVIHLYGDKVYVSQVGGGGNAEIVSFDVMWDAANKAYVFPAARDVINAIGEYIEVQLVVHTPAGVNFVYALTYKSALNYEWTREDCQSRFNLVGTGDPVVWTWAPGFTRLKLDSATLDEDIGKVCDSIAPDYSSFTFPIAEGTLCMYARNLYTCSASGGIPAIEDWNAEHWTQTKVSELIGDVETLLAAL